MIVASLTVAALFRLDKVARPCRPWAGRRGRLRDFRRCRCFPPLKPIRYEDCHGGKDSQSGLLDIGQIIKNRLVDHGVGMM